MTNRFLKYWLLFLISFATYWADAKNKPLLINGAGASFPYILYSTWFHQYTKVNNKARINYRSIGSGGGIRQLINKTVDFGASDVAMKKEEMQASSVPIVHIPATLSAVAITYNLENVSKPLRFNSEVMMKIFNGSIQRWNHPAIAKLNPGISLPDQNIVVIYRADGSGTTAVFTEYLSANQKDWLSNIGKGKSVNWPIGIGAKGNEGIMAFLRKTPGAISYVAMSYALNRKLNVALIQNPLGEFVSPSIDSVKKAGEAAIQNNIQYTDSIVNMKSKGAYPISSFTYLLIYKKMSKQKGQVIIDFLNWALTHGQKTSASLYYVPLPDNVIKQTQETIKKIQLIEHNASS